MHLSNENNVHEYHAWQNQYRLTWKNGLDLLHTNEVFRDKLIEVMKIEGNEMESGYFWNVAPTSKKNYENDLWEFVFIDAHEAWEGQTQENETFSEYFKAAPEHPAIAFNFPTKTSDPLIVPEPIKGENFLNMKVTRCFVFYYVAYETFFETNEKEAHHEVLKKLGEQIVNLLDENKTIWVHSEHNEISYFHIRISTKSNDVKYGPYKTYNRRNLAVLF